MTARKTIQARRSGPVQEITAKDSTAKDGTAKDSSPKDKAKDGSARGGAREDAGGPVAASGPRIYNLFPLLVGTVSAWRAELPRIAALGFDWVYLNPVARDRRLRQPLCGRAIRSGSMPASATPRPAATTTRSAPSPRTPPRTASR